MKDRGRLTPSETAALEKRRGALALRIAGWIDKQAEIMPGAIGLRQSLSLAAPSALRPLPYQPPPLQLTAHGTPTRSQPIGRDEGPFVARSKALIDDVLAP